MSASGPEPLPGLGAAAVRALAAELGLRPSKARGQNFVVDGNTVARIVRLAGVDAGDTVLEVGPGLGSLTVPLLGTGARVVAVELDRVLAARLPETVEQVVPGSAARLAVVTADATDLSGVLPWPGERAPNLLVANLPYSVAVPILLEVLTRVESVTGGVVMVQAEVADRLCAPPGSRVYGVPSAKVAWFAGARRSGSVPPGVFWPVPRVDSGLVALSRRPPPPSTAGRAATFAVVDAAFAQRRKTLRQALASLAGSPDAAARALDLAGVDPAARGERLDIAAFARVADALVRSASAEPARDSDAAGTDQAH